MSRNAIGAFVCAQAEPAVSPTAKRIVERRITPSFRFSTRDARRLRRAPRVLGHLLEDVSQYARRAHALREWKSQCRTLQLQFQTLGVAAHAAPLPIGSAE